MVIISQFFYRRGAVQDDSVQVNAWGSGHHHEMSNSLPVISQRHTEIIACLQLTLNMSHYLIQYAPVTVSEVLVNYEVI